MRHDRSRKKNKGKKEKNRRIKGERERENERKFLLTSFSLVLYERFLINLFLQASSLTMYENEIRMRIK